MGPVGFQSKNDCDNEGQWQFTQPDHQNNRYVQLDKEKPYICIKLDIGHTYDHSDILTAISEWINELMA
jgi:hypothetical protein